MSKIWEIVIVKIVDAVIHIVEEKLIERGHDKLINKEDEKEELDS